MASAGDADPESGAELNNPYPFSPPTNVMEVGHGDQKTPEEGKGIEITKTVELDFLKKHNKNDLDDHSEETVTHHGGDNEV